MSRTSSLPAARQWALYIARKVALDRTVVNSEQLPGRFEHPILRTAAGAAGSFSIVAGWARARRTPMATGWFMPTNAQLSDIRAGPVVAVVERGPGQPGIEGLANIGMQPTAAPWHHWRRRGS